mmetsp:Transcript_21851/g.33863  ORF Transcript_21851/g.33863 Transcript_21851/m.33863 type:complete len:88 (-) Transcript_21851:2576-2839(-)
MLTSTLEPNIGRNEDSQVLHLAEVLAKKELENQQKLAFLAQMMKTKGQTDRVNVDPAISKQEVLSLESFIQSLNARVSPSKHNSLTS